MLQNPTLRSIGAAILALAIPTTAAPHPITQRAQSELSITAQLKLADTLSYPPAVTEDQRNLTIPVSAVERYALLPNDEDFVFDFNHGAVPIASSANFPPLVGTGISFNTGQLDACSMSIVHLHPRATELFTLVSGHVLSEMIPQEGVVDSAGNQRVISVELHPNMMTIFPAGSFHTQINPDCEPANFTAAFTSDEFALGIVAKQLFSFSDEVVAATFGQVVQGGDIEKVRDGIPVALALRVEECLVKCGIEKR